MIFGGGTFERELGHEDGAFRNGTHAFMRIGQRAGQLSFHHVKVQKLVVCKPEESPNQNPTMLAP